MHNARTINVELAKLDQSQGWPVVEHVNSPDSDSALVELELAVPAGLPTFDGHFPSQAVVPGILQIHWAAHLAELCFDQLDEPPQVKQFSALKGIKFNAMVLPQAKLTLTLSYDAKKLKFSYASKQHKHSNGVLLLLGNTA